VIRRAAESTTPVRRVIVTGGPGSGKTTLLAELAAMGFATVGESARAIIAERRWLGSSPRPDPVTFAREILRRDIEQYVGLPRSSDWVFFDRGLIEAVGGLHEVAPLTAGELAAMLAAYPFHRSVFVLPPWRAIYVNDDERDQTFAEAVEVHDRIVRWYGSCGFRLDEVPRLPVAERARHILRSLGPGNDGTGGVAHGNGA
jgi:predicted ATPase